VHFYCSANCSASIEIFDDIVKFNIESTFAFESKRNSPITANGNAASVGAVAFQAMQAITQQSRRRRHTAHFTKTLAPVRIEFARFGVM
jgi:hypothetical protein